MMKNGISTQFSACAARTLAISAVFLLPGCLTQSPAPVVGFGNQPSITTPQNVHVVKKGDTLYSIAREYAMDPNDLAAFNTIENPAQIAIGQIIRIPDAPSSPARSGGAVSQPVAGDAGGVESRPLETSMAPVEVRNVPGAPGMLKSEPKAGKEPYSEEALARAQRENGETKTEPPSAVAESTWIWPAEGKVLRNYNGSDNKGINIGGKVGDPILAVESGRVILVSDTLRSYGNMLIISHGSKRVTVYAHNSKILVKEKQAVKRGQKIAEMGKGDTGQAMLHFEVRHDGQALDPVKYLPARPH